MIITAKKSMRVAMLEEHLAETRAELYEVERNVSRYGTDRVRELMEEFEATKWAIDFHMNEEALNLIRPPLR